MLSLWGKFEPGHVAICTQRPKSQVNALVVNDLDMPLSDEVLTQLAVEDSLTNEFCHFSLNAISGVEDGETMKLRAQVQDKVMLTLVDSGSSHSFVSTKFLKPVGLTPIPTRPQQVKVANGQVLITDHWIPKMSWWCNGITLQSDMKVLDLDTFDAILGYDWL